MTRWQLVVNGGRGPKRTFFCDHSVYTKTSVMPFTLHVVRDAAGFVIWAGRVIAKSTTKSKTVLNQMTVPLHLPTYVAAVDSAGMKGQLDPDRPEQATGYAAFSSGNTILPSRPFPKVTQVHCNPQTGAIHVHRYPIPISDQPQAMTYLEQLVLRPLLCLLPTSSGVRRYGVCMGILRLQ